MRLLLLLIAALLHYLLKHISGTVDIAHIQIGASQIQFGRHFVGIGQKIKHIIVGCCCICIDSIGLQSLTITLWVKLKSIWILEYLVNGPANIFPCCLRQFRIIAPPCFQFIKLSQFTQIQILRQIVIIDIIDIIDIIIRVIITIITITIVIIL